MMQVTCKHCHHDCLCISSSRARSICGCLSLATFSSVRISLLGRGWNTSACLELSPPKRQTNKYSHCKTDSNNAPLRKKKKKTSKHKLTSKHQFQKAHPKPGKTPSPPLETDLHRSLQPTDQPPRSICGRSGRVSRPRRFTAATGMGSRTILRNCERSSCDVRGL